MVPARMRVISLVAILVAVFNARTVLAQPVRAARIQVTVVDTSGAVVPDATVDVVGLEDATRKSAVAPVKTSGAGLAVVDGLAPGRYSIRATFPGFDIGLVRDVRLRAGDNRHVVVLPLQRLQESVTVSQSTQAAAADRRRSDFGLQLADDQIQALSDDPQELARQIADLAVDITWMSIANVYYEIGSLGVLTDGYFTRIRGFLFTVDGAELGFSK